MQWKHWFAPYPELDHVQLEVSTFCNALCAYCPRTTAGNSWNTFVDNAASDWSSFLNKASA